MVIPWNGAARAAGVIRRSLPGIVCCALGLAGCASPLPVGPNYAAPNAADMLSAERWQAALPHEGETVRDHQASMMEKHRHP